MAINLLGAIGSVSGTMYSKKMAIRAQKNFQSQLDLKREIETGKLDFLNKQLEEKIRHNQEMEKIQKYDSETKRKHENAYMRDIRNKEAKFKASLANNTTNTMKEGEQ